MICITLGGMLKFLQTVHKKKMPTIEFALWYKLDVGKVNFQEINLNSYSPQMTVINAKIIVCIIYLTESFSALILSSRFFYLTSHHNK